MMNMATHDALTPTDPAPEACVCALQPKHPLVLSGSSFIPSGKQFPVPNGAARA